MRRLLAAVLLAGCASTDDPNATFSNIRAHDMGDGKWLISCLERPRYCAEQSVRSCPDGFEVISTTSTPLVPGTTRTTMIIECD